MSESGLSSIASDHSPDASPISGEPAEDPFSPGLPPGGCQAALILETADIDPPLEGWLDVQLVAIMQLAGLTEAEIALVVVDDAQMCDLHEQYHQDPTTTDVLTFDLRDEPAEPVQGDIVICLDEAKRQAALRSHEPRLEVLLYAVHGLMHLLGEDDHDPDDAKRMHAREDQLLQQAGFGAVYARPASSGDDSED